MLGAAGELLAEFPHLDVDAEVGRQWWDLPGVVTAHVKGGVGAGVIISLGTNGTWSAGEIQGALAPLGTRPVVLVNTFENRSWSADVNAQIAAVAANRPHTCVADWHGLASRHQQWVSYDGVHPDAEGRRAYADLLRQAVDSCR
jgi:lysophospholipase L1-like esterase